MSDVRLIRDMHGRVTDHELSAAAFVLCNPIACGAPARAWTRPRSAACRAPEALNPADEYEKKYIGWLELDNGFFFFVDETAWRETCKLFGAEVEDVEVP